ncbi:HECA2 protein, partial [Sylvia borin]|nr:HECA2 protein [Sylvia borin]
QLPPCAAPGPCPGSTGRARRKGPSSATPSTSPPTCPCSTRTAPPSTSPTCRCGWCCSTGTAASTASGPRRRPRRGSTCTSWVSDSEPPWWLGAGIAPAVSADLPLPLPEPLSQPKILGNSLVKAGGSTKLVCNVVEGKADAYWWKKNGEPLLRSERVEFVENTTLCILQASLRDSGYYTCVVSNAVSQNETSVLLQVH